MTKMACEFDPSTIEGPIGMLYCPLCGEMVLAGYRHPDYDNIDYSFLEEKPMTHSWSLGEYEVAPGLVISQYLMGGPTLIDRSKPNGPMELAESVSWTLYNTTLRDRVKGERDQQYYQCWLWELSITEEQAVVFLRAAGFTVERGKAGLCRINTLIVKHPDAKPWELSPDFFPEGYPKEEEDQ